MKFFEDRFGSVAAVTVEEAECLAAVLAIDSGDGQPIVEQRSGQIFISSADADVRFVERLELVARRQLRDQNDIPLAVLGLRLALQCRMQMDGLDGRPTRECVQELAVALQLAASSPPRARFSKRC